MNKEVVDSDVLPPPRIVPERVFHARLAPSGFSSFCFLTKSAWLVLVLDRSLASFPR